MTVLACVDGSRFMPSVSNYAARAALRMNTGVIVLHAIARDTAASFVDLSGAMTTDLTASTLDEFTRIGEAHNRLTQ